MRKMQSPWQEVHGSESAHINNAISWRLSPAIALTEQRSLASVCDNGQALM